MTANVIRHITIMGDDQILFNGRKYHEYPDAFDIISK